MAYLISIDGVGNDDRHTLVGFLEDRNGVDAVIAKRRSGLIAFSLSRLAFQGIVAFLS
jgi:hypothetical protein